MSEERDTPKATDWERIEAQYSAGTMSLREIAGAHDITEGAIRKRAKKDGWTRDLSVRVQAKADELVRQATVRAERPVGDSPTEKQVVEVEATVQSRIRLEHRTDIQRSKRIVNALMEQLEALVSPEPAEPDEGAEPSKPSAPSISALKEQAGVLDKLVSTQKTLVGMEREAFGIAQMVENPDAPTAIDPMDGARRLLFVLNRAAALNSQGKP